MDDQFLHDQRREPDPGYARSLREHLRGIEATEPARGFRLHPALLATAAVALVAASFMLPAVRVAAQNALDVFRVQTFTAVEIDGDMQERFKQLQDMGDDPMSAILEKQDLHEPAKPVDYPSADLAASAAGLPGLRKPGPMPAGLTFEKATATGQGSARFIVHAAKVQHVLDVLGINDVHVPMAFDGKSISVHMPSSVIQRFKSGKRELAIIEANSPEVSLPPGADLKQMGEIGLRVLGLEPDEARRTAASIDWRNTLVVPVPTNAASFRQVDINGHQGLMIRTSGEPASEANGGRARRGGVMVMWSEGNRVFAVQGDVQAEDVLEVAQSLR
ncbi:MAG: hypothetical protein ABL977_00680 [Candidatus Eisenbacteria bacterium]